MTKRIKKKIKKKDFEEGISISILGLSQTEISHIRGLVPDFET